MLKIKEILENKTERISTGSRAREFVIENYAPEAIAKKYIELIING